MAEVILSQKDGQKGQPGLLEQYANATKTKVVNSPSDLDAKDKVMEEMFHWCKEQGNIVVLSSGTILSNDLLHEQFKTANHYY